MDRKKTIAAVWLLSVALSSAGCWFAAGAGAGAVTYAYVKGEAKTTFASPAYKVKKAVVAALTEDLHLTLASKEGAEVKALTIDNRKVTVKLIFVESNITEVRVRVGLMGDRNMSNTILSKTAERLQAPPR